MSVWTVATWESTSRLDDRRGRSGRVAADTVVHAEGAKATSGVGDDHVAAVPMHPGHGVERRRASAEHEWSDD
jgi:hypothetical protein